MARANRLDMNSSWHEQVIRASIPSLRALGTIIEGDYKSGVHRVTDDLYDSIYSDVDEATGTIEVGATSEHAAFHEQGTAPHTITGKDGKRLAFLNANGNLIRPYSVNHPGTKENPALASAVLRQKGRQFHA